MKDYTVRCLQTGAVSFARVVTKRWPLISSAKILGEHVGISKACNLTLALRMLGELEVPTQAMHEDLRDGPNWGR